MARTITFVSTDELRDWARENDWTDEKGREVSERGRVSTKLINDFNKANKRNWKQYQPISRNPQGYVPQEPAQAQPAQERQPARQQASTPAPRRQRDTSDAPSPRNTVEDSNGVNSLSEVIAMLQAAEKKGGKGRPAVVTIQTLVTV